MRPERLPWPLALYRGATTIGEPLGAAFLALRARMGKEDRARLPERRGIASLARPPGPLVWAHGASVGETISLMPLVERLTGRGLPVLVTSGTVTSAAILARRLPPGAFHQFLPLDVPRYMRRFLEHWRPTLALIAESELWPNLLVETRARGVPLVMVNGRMSERSFRRWRKLPEAAQAALGAFDLCLAQSRLDAERLGLLGAPRVSPTGNLKFDVPAPSADPNALALLEGLTAGRPLWLAASTHPGEEEEVVAVHRALAGRLPGLLTIIVPRHARRGREVEAIARAEGLAVALRSAGQTPERGIDIYVADTMGELGLFYRLAPVVFMGGSLIPHGGQNPIEPAKLGAAILHGPHVHNFLEVCGALAAAGGAIEVADGEALARAVFRLLTHADEAREIARNASRSMGEISGAADRVMAAIEPLLPRPARLAGAVA